MTHHCEECGIIVPWKDLIRITDKNGKEHRLCIDCAQEKYGQGQGDSE